MSNSRTKGSIAMKGSISGPKQRCLLPTLRGGRICDNHGGHSLFRCSCIHVSRPGVRVADWSSDASPKRSAAIIYCRQDARAASPMPITDVMKKQLAQRHRLFFKICRTCGSRNSPNAYRCRRCRGDNLRWKKRELGAK